MKPLKSKVERVAELNRELTRIKKSHALLVPVFEGPIINIVYREYRMVDIAPKNKALLLKRGWPSNMIEVGNWPNFGGLKYKTFTVQGTLVQIDNRLQPIAQCVVEDEKHNLLLQRNLLVGHGFPTDMGWYRCVNKGTVIDRDVLTPSSNPLDLPKPIDWQLVAI